MDVAVDVMDVHNMILNNSRRQKVVQLRVN